MSKCPECQATYSPNGGGHCHGGAYGGCCRTFTSDRAASAHFAGPYDDGTGRSGRYCIDVSQDAKWRLTDRGWTNRPPRPESSYTRVAVQQEGA